MTQLDRTTQLEQELRDWEQLVKANPNNPNAFVRRGMARFKLGQIGAAIEDFDRAEQVDERLTPYLWQRGLAYYYAQRFEAGAAQFELDLTVNGQDVEETVWRYLCIAQSRGGDAAIATLLPVRHDPRPFMQPVYALYAAQISVEALLAWASAAEPRGQFYCYLYIGPHYEAWRDAAQAKHYLLLAAQANLFDDYMWHLAIVHCQLRGWK